MALANIGISLAKWGYKVLLLDWDLEAPGLENFCKAFLNVEETKNKLGLIDLLKLRLDTQDINIEKIAWEDYVNLIEVNNVSNLHLITAGRRDQNYIESVRLFDYIRFYKEFDGGEYLESLREFWLDNYDFVLIDSRTGLTDSSGICSIHMPDILLLLFTPNEQSFYGIKDVSKKAIEGQKEIIYDRFQLRTLPIPCRIENAETLLLDEWMKKIVKESEDMLEWLPRKENKEYLISPFQLINQVKIPYKTFYAYGEKLAVSERDTNDPNELGYIYETIAAVLANDLQDSHLLVDSRDALIKKVKGEEITDTTELLQKVKDEKELKTKVELLLKDKINQEQEFKATYKKRRSRIIVYSILGAVLLALVISFISYSLNRSSATLAIVTSPDSLTKARSYADFVTTYTTSEQQYDLNFNLEMIKNYYKLDKKYQDTLLDIKQQIEQNIAANCYNLIDTMYASLRKKNFSASTFFSDTLTVGILRNVTVQYFQSRVDSILQFRNIKNVSIDTTFQFKSDSLGFYVTFHETGNILIDKLQEYESFLNLASIFFTPNLRIKSFTYKTTKHGKLSSPYIYTDLKGRKRADLFVCSDQLRDQSLKTIIGILQGQNYNVIMKNFRNPPDSSSPYHVSSNEIRYYGNDEYKLALALQQAFLNNKMDFKLKAVRISTPNIISVFVCGDFRSKSLLKK